jgi:hypothetical protein
MPDVVCPNTHSRVSRGQQYGNPEIAATSWTSKRLSGGNHFFLCGCLCGRNRSAPLVAIY